jgi:hypothetical protein
MFVAPPATTESLKGAIIPGPVFPRPGHSNPLFSRQSKSWWKTEPIADTDRNAVPSLPLPHPPRWIGAFVRHFRGVGSVFEAACYHTYYYS